MKTIKLVNGSGAGFRCAVHRHGVEAYCGAKRPVMSAMVISGGSNLDEPIGLNSRGVEYLGISLDAFNINQWGVIQ